jgi:hypothetical protein
MSVTGSFSATGASTALLLSPGESVTWATTVAADETFSGRVLLERSRDGGQTWQLVQAFDGRTVALTSVTGSQSGTVVNETTDRVHVRVRCDDAGADDAIAYALTDVVDAERVITNRHGQTVATVNDDGSLTIPHAAIGNFAVLLAAAINALPTVDPAVAGALFLDAGVLTVSAGA